MGNRSPDIVGLEKYTEDEQHGDAEQERFERRPSLGIV